MYSANAPFLFRAISKKYQLSTQIFLDLTSMKNACNAVSQLDFCSINSRTKANYSASIVTSNNCSNNTSKFNGFP